MKKILSLITLILIAFQLNAQIIDPVSWGYKAKRISSKEVTLLIKATMNDGWHIYSINQKGGGPQPTIFDGDRSKDYELVGKLIEPKPTVKYEKVFEMNVFEYRYFFSKGKT